MSNYPWVGRAKRINDHDLPRIGHKIGVGEDIVHMFLDVESRGVGFDSNGVIKLFEEHKFYKHVSPSLRDKAVRAGVAHPKWRSNYKNNHSRFMTAYSIDPMAALMSCSWGLGQIMGENCRMVGYGTALDMVKAFADDEANQLEAMIDFVVTAKIDDELRAMERTPSSNRAELIRLARIVARTYNGSGYERNNYHNRLVDRLIWWRGKPDTPWSPDMAIKEEVENTVVEEQKEIVQNEIVLEANEVEAQREDEVEKQEVQRYDERKDVQDEGQKVIKPDNTPWLVALLQALVRMLGGK